jgi:rod shape-determining protein MreC
MPLFPKDKRAPRLFIALIILHLLLISFQVPRGPAPSVFERGLFFVLSPFQHGGQAVFRFIRGVWTGYFNLVGVQRQNRALIRNEFLLQQENALLRRVVEMSLPTLEMKTRLEAVRGSILPAAVISLDPVNYYKSMIIDKGTLDGLEKDMVVLDRFGNLMGRIIEPLSLKEASVQLITDDASGTSVFIRGEKGLGVVTGDGHGRCLLKYVLDTATGINPGDEVLTSGFDKIYPWGISLGRVVSLSSSQSLFKEIVIQPHFRFRDLSRVAILKSRGPFFK